MVILSSSENFNKGAPGYNYYYNDPVKSWYPYESNTFALNLSRGIISGYKLLHLYGRNTDVDGTEDVWGGGGVYAGFPTGTAETLSFTSTNNADSFTGSGMKMICVYGLNQNFQGAEEYINLSGTAPAYSTGLFKRVNDVKGKTAGSYETNLGNITVTHSTTTSNVFSVIPAGFGQSQRCVYTVATGFSACIDGYSASMFDNTANRATLALRIKEYTGSAQMYNPFVISTDNSFMSNFYGFRYIPEMSDFSIRVLSVLNANADISATISLILIKN